MGSRKQTNKVDDLTADAELSITARFGPATTANTIKEKPFYTARQIGEIYEVRETTVREWLRRGLLRGVRLGKAWRVTAAELERFGKSDQH